jgi:hypothetical protein
MLVDAVHKKCRVTVAEGQLSSCCKLFDDMHKSEHNIELYFATFIVWNDRKWYSYSLCIHIVYEYCPFLGGT